MDENTPNVDERILQVLRESGKPLTTYQIAKKAKVSWSTANVHLKDLQLRNLVKSKEDVIKSRKSKIWWMEQSTIEKFLNK